MSVVVRMEMPQHCGECNLYVDGWCYALTPDSPQEKEWYASHKERPPMCPIICQLPEGHGRLIDVDAMAEDLNYDIELDAKALDDMNIIGYARERFQFDKNRKQDCIRYLSGQKIIVPAEAERSETL